ncbi:MAG TPA: phospholipase D-like domain-containing protein, partial [Polyangiales bacterium]
LPNLVLPAYLLFGTRKLARVRKLPGSPAVPHEHWAQRVLGSFGLAPAADVRTRLHADGASALQALREVVGAAREQLDIAMFIVGDDAVGKELAERLADKVRDGVRVRLLLDGLGKLMHVSRGVVAALRTAGVEIMIFRPPLRRVLDGPRNLRNHRKLVIADGRRLWAGGRNLAAEYFLGSPQQPAWVDLSFDLEGPLAADASAQFEFDWAASGGSAAAPRPRAPVAQPNGSAQFLPSGPDQVEDTAHSLLVDACFRAERRLMAVTPYFLPDASLLAALRLAARRGVRISLFLPARSNHRLTDFARSRALRELTMAGVEVLLVPYMLHAKAVVLDESLALTGSVNLDLRSLMLNHESAVVFYDRAQIEWLASWIEGLRADASAYAATPPGLLRDFAEGLLLSLAFQL